MSIFSKKEYLHEIRIRYLQADKKQKKEILNEFCINCGYNRKYAIRILNNELEHRGAKQRKVGRPCRYNNPEIREFLIKTWKTSNLLCSKRLKAIIPIWIDGYQKTYGGISKEVIELLKEISPATIDRILVSIRRRYSKHGLSTTKPGSIIKEFIPIKTDQWNEFRPGFIEADTVAHCGSSVSGTFAYTLDMVDIATGWTFQRATWGKESEAVLEAIKDIESVSPFKILGFDCDNGNEFLNWPLITYFKQRQNPVQHTRSRPYQKNDNAHIEGKNWTIVRQYLGYERFDKKEIVPLMNELYKNGWYRFLNFFIPSVKLINKERVGSKIVKKYDKPKTPLQRLLESDNIPTQTKQKLISEFRKLNPYELEDEINHRIKQIIDIAINYALT